ncbi:MAG: 50S ribosomal protein L10 [Patescibacteria group bacterium]|nr:50S ribosomal protein L10 [Patescibacteria group bacterium]
MAKTREQKEKMVKETTDKLNKAKSLIFANFTGLKVNEVQELKKEARKQDVEFSVVKNSLFKLALKNSDKKDVKVEEFKGPRAVAFGYSDEVAPAKILHTFAKKHKVMQLLGGILDKALLSTKEVANLAKLPSKEEMLAKTVGTIKAPITSFVNVMAGNLRGLINVLNAVKDKKPAGK